MTFVEAEGEYGPILMRIAAELRAGGWSVSLWRGSEQTDVGLLMVDGACFEAVLEDENLRVWRFTRESLEDNA